MRHAHLSPTKLCCASTTLRISGLQLKPLPHQPIEIKMFIIVSVKVTENMTENELETIRLMGYVPEQLIPSWTEG
jgi:hypothetical protein